jgi:hypothetical protein
MAHEPTSPADDATGLMGGDEPPAEPAKPDVDPGEDTADLKAKPANPPTEAAADPAPEAATADLTAKAETADLLGAAETADLTGSAKTADLTGRA